MHIFVNGPPCPYPPPPEHACGLLTRFGEIVEDHFHVVRKIMIQQQKFSSSVSTSDTNHKSLICHSPICKTKMITIFLNEVLYTQVTLKAGLNFYCSRAGLFDKVLCELQCNCFAMWNNSKLTPFGTHNVNVS